MLEQSRPVRGKALIMYTLAALSMLLPLQGASIGAVGVTQGVASLALGYVLHWAFSPPLTNPKLQFFSRVRISLLFPTPTRDASPPLVVAFRGSA